MIKINSIKEFKDYVSSLAIVDFYAEWCGPCKMLSPIIEKLSEEYDDKITFAKVDVDKFPEIAKKYNILSIPTMIIFKDGEEADRLVGFTPEEQLIAFLDKNIIANIDISDGSKEKEKLNIIINTDQCIGCGVCVSVCPTGAIELDDDGKAYCNDSLCVKCVSCVIACPVSAIKSIIG